MICQNSFISPVDLSCSVQYSCLLIANIAPLARSGREARIQLGAKRPLLVSLGENIARMHYEINYVRSVGRYWCSFPTNSDALIKLCWAHSRCFAFQPPNFSHINARYNTIKTHQQFHLKTSCNSTSLVFSLPIENRKEVNLEDTVKTKHPFSGMLYLFWMWNWNGGRT